jgi:peptidoglycan/LPS O-acetylase OafA/YrhL
MKRNLEIDRLRGVAVFMVMLVHAADYFEYVKIGPHFLWKWFGSFSVGVDLFFVISGFVVSGSIESLLKGVHIHSENGAGNFAKFLRIFYTKRIFRILPLSWLVLVIFTLAFIFVEGFSDRTNFAIRTAVAAIDFSANYFLYFTPPEHYSMSPFGHYWSLAIEEQFYMAFPIFLFLVPDNKRRVSILSFLLIIITFIIRPLFFQAALDAGHSRAAFATHFRIDGIVWGCILYRISQTKFLSEFQFQERVKPFLGFLISALFFLAISGAKWVLPPIYWIPSVAMLSTILVAIASLGGEIVFPIYGLSHFLDWLGSRSYGLYLVNWPLLWLLEQIFHDNFFGSQLVQKDGGGSELASYLFTALWFLASLLLTEIFYRFFEMPILKYGHEISKEFPKPIVSEK